MRYGSRHLIDLNLLEENYLKLKKLCPSNEALFMVKADAYGHGLVNITDFSYNELGIKNFGCATIGEALKLREELGGERFEVYVFSDIQLQLQNYSEAYLDQRLIPVLTNFDDLNFFLNEACFNHFPICLKFNTGMNRLGFNWTEVEAVAQKLKSKGRKKIYHLMTHFACASQSMFKNKRNNDQRERFDEIKKFLRAEGFEIERTSISNSGAIEQLVGLEESHVRPGLMMYGPSSLIPQLSEKTHWDGKIISSLETYVIKVFDVKKGWPVGYGATPVPEEGKVAIIALGYGDGFSTRFTGTQLNFNEYKGTVVGRVNMDMSQVLFPSNCPIKEGDKFTVWNENPAHFNQLCEKMETIPYEVFIQLTSRVPKVYRLK